MQGKGGTQISAAVKAAAITSQEASPASQQGGEAAAWACTSAMPLLQPHRCSPSPGCSLLQPVLAPSSSRKQHCSLFPLCKQYLQPSHPPPLGLPAFFARTVPVQVGGKVGLRLILLAINAMQAFQAPQSWMQLPCCTRMGCNGDSKGNPLQPRLGVKGGGSCASFLFLLLLLPPWKETGLGGSFARRTRAQQQFSWSWALANLQPTLCWRGS